MPGQNISYFKLSYFCTSFYFVKGIRKMLLVSFGSIGVLACSVVFPVYLKQALRSRGG